MRPTSLSLNPFFNDPCPLEGFECVERVKRAVRSNDAKELYEALAERGRDPQELHFPFYLLRMCLDNMSQAVDDPACVRVALGAGAHPDGLDGPRDCVENDLPPLCMALHANLIQLARALLEAGANPNWFLQGACPLSLLAGSSADAGPGALLLLEQGALPDGPGASDPASDNPLIFCARFNKPEMAALLLRAGANPKLTDTYGRDALTVAAQFHQSEARSAIAAEIERQDLSRAAASAPARPGRSL